MLWAGGKEMAPSSLHLTDAARAIVIPRGLSPRDVPFVTRARYVSRNSISLSQYRVTAPISMRARATFGTFRRGVLSGEGSRLATSA